jgi:EAL domain-containing protein (putative c-di-GMP-specific phosphodiesterase class I)
VLKRARLLAELGCDEVQGFHLGRPLRGHDLTHWLCEQYLPLAA